MLNKVTQPYTGKSRRGYAAKIFFSILFSLIVVTVIKADDDKYTKAMKKSLSKMDSLSNLNSFIDAANSFERIARAEKDKWLPYYYASYLYTVAGFIDTVKEKKDGYLDKVDELINIADSLQPDEPAYRTGRSEVYTLKGMVAQARLQIDPMNRWMKYGPEATNNFQKAMELDSLNPRPEYLMGVGIFYTPEQFGGGAQAAKPYFEKSLKKFDEFKVENELMPNWGRDMLEKMISQVGE